jgi:hypothetical protein
MEILVPLVQALAWPLTSLTVVLIFQGELRAAVGRLSRFKYKDLEASFDKGLKAAEETANKSAIPKSGERKALSRTGYPAPDAEQLHRVSGISPRAAILEAWIAVEQAAFEVAQGRGIQTQAGVMDRRLIQLLEADRLIDRQTASLHSELQRLRNTAAHAPEFALRPSEAERYIELALGLADLLRSLVRDS